MGDLDEPFFDVDVGIPVLAHGPQLDEVDLGVDLGDGVHEVQRADDVVHLGVDRVLTVDHGVGGGPLLAEVHDGIGLALGDGGIGEGGIGEVADAHVDAVAGDLVPLRYPLGQGVDRHQAVDAHFDVVLPPHQVVDHGDAMTQSREMEGSRPPQVAVTAEHQNVHPHPFLDRPAENRKAHSSPILCRVSVRTLSGH